MLSAIEDVEFSFNNIMYGQVDGFSMSSPLGPVLANMLCWFSWKPSIRKTPQASWIFMLCIRNFYNLWFYWWCQGLLHTTHFPSFCHSVYYRGRELPFLDVLVERKEGSFITGVYRKFTFTGFYTNWNSFVTKSPKTNLISTLLHRTLMICSPCKSDQEIENIYDIFCDKVYAGIVIKRTVERKIKCFKSPVVLVLPCILYI